MATNSESCYVFEITKDIIKVNMDDDILIVSKDHMDKYAGAFVVMESKHGITWIDSQSIISIIETKEKLKEIFYPAVNINYTSYEWYLFYDLLAEATIYKKIEFKPLDELKIDITKYPHICPVCSSPAYIGLLGIECSKIGCKG